MQRLDFLVHPRRVPSDGPALERHFLRTVSQGVPDCGGVLRVYDFRGDVLSLGRYHLTPEGPLPAALHLHRRASGGRALPFGDGFVGLSLVLPHRSALCADDPFALAPYQVPNRYVRGILEGCKLAGVPAVYPGRDWITVNRRRLGLVSFEVDASGALLFEAIIATQRDFSLLPAWLDAVDPAGVVKTEMLTPEMTTCLARELGTALATEEVADLLRRGFEKQFARPCVPRVLTAQEEQAIAAVAADDARGGDGWLRQRRWRAELTHHGMERVQLGVLEAYSALRADRCIAAIVLAGDFIADSAGIARLEAELCGCPADARALDAAVAAVLSHPEHFILGIGPAHTIAATILKGLHA